MIFYENDFLKTYTNINKLWETATMSTEVAEIDSSLTSEEAPSKVSLTISDLDDRLATYNSGLADIIGQTKRVSPELINLKGVVFFLPGGVEIGVHHKRALQPLARAMTNAGAVSWCYTRHDQDISNLSSTLQTKLFSLDEAWVGFYFFFGRHGSKDRPNVSFLDLLIEQLSERFPQLDWQTWQFTKFLPGSPCKRFEGAYGICVKYSPAASFNTLAALTTLTEVEKTTASFEALECATEIARMGPQSCIGSFLQEATETAFSSTAFYVPDLVKYYEEGTYKQRKQLRALLSCYRTKLTGTYDSLQYLYNAGLQEHILSEFLHRNPSATKVLGSEDEESYHYLVPKIARTSISQWTSHPDFLFSNEGRVYTVDAKIYWDRASMWENISKESTTHRASFLIVYLKSGTDTTQKWLVLGRHSTKNSAWQIITEENAQTSTEKLLSSIVKTLPHFECIKLD